MVFGHYQPEEKVGDAYEKIETREKRGNGRL